MLVHNSTQLTHHTSNSVAVAQMPPAGTPAAMLEVDLDLIHCCLGHACEAMCHTHVQHSELYSDAQKACLCSSHLSQPCHVFAIGKQATLPHQKVPTLPEEHAEHPSTGLEPRQAAGKKSRGTSRCSVSYS